jgi:hypothetical protein
MRDTGLADRIRAKGVEVVEVAGWEDRGRDGGDSPTFRPVGAIHHHTAGPESGVAPSLATVIYGRPDVPGPLAQVVQSREADPSRDKAYVVAAGKANHGGVGAWSALGLTMDSNYESEGLEVEHTGVGNVPVERLEVSARILAAMLEAPGSSGSAGMCCEHFEYARPLGRKVDFRELGPYTPETFRARVAYWIGRTAGEDDEMSAEDVKRLEAKVDRVLAQLDTNNDNSVASRTLGSLRRIENEHRRQVLGAVESVRGAVMALLAPFGTEWVDRSGNRLPQGAPGAVETSALQRWVIEALRRLRGTWPSEPPAEPPTA